MYRELRALVKSAALLTACALLLGMGDLQEQLDRSRYLEQQLDRLTSLYRQGESEEVLRLLRTELDGVDLSPRLWNLRGLALQATGQLGEAIASYEAGIRLDPSRSELHQNLAIALVALGATGRALSEFQQAIELDPGAVEARLGLANELLRLRRAAAARPHLESVLQWAPVDPRVHSALARLADAEGDTASSRRWWGALERSRPTADSSRRLGELTVVSSPDSAIAYFDRCAARDSLAVDCLQAAAALLLDRGDPAGARARLERADARLTLDAAGEVNLLLALWRSGAQEALEGRVTERPPISGAGWGIVALSRRERGLGEAAVEAARTAAEMAPGDPAVANLLGVVLAEHGAVEEALAIWRRVLATHPDHSEARANLASYGRD